MHGTNAADGNNSGLFLMMKQLSALKASLWVEADVCIATSAWTRPAVVVNS